MITSGGIGERNATHEVAEDAPGFLLVSDDTWPCRLPLTKGLLGPVRAALDAVPPVRGQVGRPRCGTRHRPRQCRQTWEHSNSTVAMLPLDALGHVPWWPAERREVTLNHVLVRVAREVDG